MSVQAKLLRAIELGEIRRVGDTKLRNVNVRVISATNKDIEKEIKEGRFREDLYYRLNVITIKLPPLREHKEDIPVLAAHFLKKHGARLGKKGLVLSQAALDKLMNYPWAGNIRELENVIQKAIILSDENPIPPKAIVFESYKEEKTPRTLEEIEKKAILSRIEECGGDKRMAANSLGIPVRTLYHKLRKWGVTT